MMGILMEILRVDTYRFLPLKEIELVAFVQYLITPKENSTAFSGINGRGVGYK